MATSTMLTRSFNLSLKRFVSTNTIQHTNCLSTMSMRKKHARYFSSSNESIESMVNDFVNSNDVAIYSKSWCPFCARAKYLFETEYSDKYSIGVVELDQMPDYKQASQIQNYIGQTTGVTTVPQVFVRAQCIGGSTEAINMHNSGELQQLLENNN